MAIYRQVHTEFWTDSKISDSFTPEDRYFMLFLLTNPYTNMIGCYEMSKKHMAFLMGYSIDTITSLIDRFVSMHKIVEYDDSTKEIMILNWSKYNWINNPKLLPKMVDDLKQLKSLKFKNHIHEKLQEFFKKDIPTDTVSIPYTYDIDTITHEENKKENEKENENKNNKERESKKNIKESGNGKSSISRPSPMSKPSISEISEFLKSLNLEESKIDFGANKFFNYYEARGWFIDGQPIYDWKSLIQYWLDISINRSQNGYTGKKVAPVPEWMDEFKQMLDQGN